MINNQSFLVFNFLILYSVFFGDLDNLFDNTFFLDKKEYLRTSLDIFKFEYIYWYKGFSMITLNR